jgi:hypothetical protein
MFSSIPVQFNMMRQTAEFRSCSNTESIPIQHSATIKPGLRMFYSINAVLNKSNQRLCPYMILFLARDKTSAFPTRGLVLPTRVQPRHHQGQRR